MITGSLGNQAFTCMINMFLIDIKLFTTAKVQLGSIGKTVYYTFFT